MSFRIIKCEIDGDAVSARTVVAGLAATPAAAEALLVRLAQSHLESGYNAYACYWWAHDPLGGEIRFFVERTPDDETDGV